MADAKSAALKCVIMPGLIYHGAGKNVQGIGQFDHALLSVWLSFTKKPS